MYQNSWYGRESSFHVATGLPASAPSANREIGAIGANRGSAIGLCLTIGGKMIEFKGTSLCKERQRGKADLCTAPSAHKEPIRGC
jgi:hypothetical protein